ncbi:MAG: ATP-binding protein, partial [Thermoanaerobaculia bacterium]
MELLEREPCLEALAGALRLAGSGSGRIAAIYGEAGIGKTSLLEAFAAAHAGEARIFWSGCEALSTPRALGPLHDVARLTRGPLERGLAGETERSALFAIALDELARVAPTVLLVEDVHWADDATLDLLKFLGRRVAHLPLLVVLTWRDDEVGAGHPLRRTLGDIPAYTLERIRLERLSEAAVRRMSDAAARDGRDVFRVTGGNPFFVTEVLMREGGGVPESIRDAVLARTSRLGAAARDAMELVSVIPSRAERWLLAGDVTAGIDACIRAGVLVECDGWVMFRHELARMAVEETLDAARRRELHRRVLTRLEERGGEVERARLAHHAVHSGDDAAALRHLLAAGARAAALGAHREAAAHYEGALEHRSLLEPAAEADLLERLFRQLQTYGWSESAREMLSRALEIRRRLGDPAAVGRDLRWMSRITWLCGDMAGARAWVEEASAVLERLPESAGLAMVWSTRSQLAMLAEHDDESLAWGRRALELARRLGDTETIVHALTNIGTTMMLRDRERGLADLRAALSLAKENEFHEQASRVYACLVSAFGVQRSVAEAIEATDEGIAYTTALDLDSWTHYVRGWRAFALLHAGRFDEAEAHAHAVLSAPGDHASVGRISALTALGRLLVRRRDASAAAVVEEAIGISISLDTVQRLALDVSSLAEAAWLAGDMEPVLPMLRATWRKALERRQGESVSELSFWLWRAGELREPPDFAVLPWVHQIRGDWRRAAEEWGALGCPYERAMALADGDARAVTEGAALLERIGATAAAA